MIFDAKNKRAKKLSQSEVTEMRRYYGEGITQGQLSRAYGVTVGTVGRICRGESWQEGAGARMPTQEEMDATAGRIMTIQEAVNNGLIEPKVEVVKPAAGSIDPKVQAQVDFYLGKRKEVPDAGY